MTLSYGLAMSLTSSITGDLNPAVVTMSFDGSNAAISPNETGAAMAFYVAQSLQFSAAGTVKITGIREIRQPGPGFNELVFPAAQYAAIRANYSGASVVPAMTDYGVPFATGADPSGRGDSICVATKSVSGSRHGQGKHFLPFTAKGAIDGNGLVSTAAANLIQEFYREIFLGAPHTHFTTDNPVLNPVVYSRNNNLAYTIYLARTVLTPSRLKTRTK